jgi:hypothetical protein
VRLARFVSALALVVGVVVAVSCRESNESDADCEGCEYGQIPPECCPMTCVSEGDGCTQYYCGADGRTLSAPNPEIDTCECRGLATPYGIRGTSCGPGQCLVTLSPSGPECCDFCDAGEPDAEGGVCVYPFCESDASNDALEPPYADVVVDAPADVASDVADE